MKKSNHLNGRPDSRAAKQLVYGRTIETSESAEYARIIKRILAWNKAGSRPAALWYLAKVRPWLAEYVKPAQLPASGELLDQILASHDTGLTRRHSLFRAKDPGHHGEKAPAQIRAGQNPDTRRIHY